MSSDVLAILAGLHLRVERAQGRLGLFGLDPVLRDMVRICRLERVFDLYTDEGEALSNAKAAGDRRDSKDSGPPSIPVSAPRPASERSVPSDRLLSLSRGGPRCARSFS
jgi:hypothetical protein